MTSASNSNQHQISGQALSPPAIASSAKVNQTSSMQRFGESSTAHHNIRKVQPTSTVSYGGQNAPIQMSAVGHSTGQTSDQRIPQSNQKAHAGIKYQTADPKGMTLNNSGNLGRVPLSQRGQRQQNNVVQGKFVGNQTVQPTQDNSPNKGNFIQGSGPGSQTHPSTQNRRQGQRKQLVAQSLNIRNQYGTIGNQQQFFPGSNADKAVIHQYGASGPIVTRASGSNNQRVVSDSSHGHGVGIQTTREKNRTGGLSQSTGPPNPYLSNSMQGNGQNTYHALRHMDGQNAFVVGTAKPNSKKHNRTLSNDDRVMEVEGFTDNSNMNTGSTFQNKSNSIRNDADPHGWGGTDQGHQKQGGMIYDQNGMPVSNYELATSKPLNSSRGIMNRRFQKHQGMNHSDHQRQISSNSGQANLPQYGSGNYSDGNPSGGHLFPRDGGSGSNQNKNKLLKSNQNFGGQMQGAVNRSLNMNYQRGTEQSNSGGQNPNIHYQNAEYVPQTSPHSGYPSAANSTSSTHRMLRPKTGENVGNSQTAQNAGLSVFANRQPRPPQGSQGPNHASQTLQANSTKRMNNLKQNYHSNPPQEGDKNFSRGSRQYQGFKGNDKTQRGDSINSYGPTSGPPLSPSSTGQKQFFPNQHSANSQQRSATSGHGRMVLNPVNNSYNSQNASGFNPNKLIGGNHKQNLLGSNQGPPYQHGGLSNPKSHRGELYQGNRPISHGDTIQGIGKQNQIQSSSNVVQRGQNQIQHSADFKSHKQWANSQGDIQTAGAQRDLSHQQHPQSSSQDAGRINISINKYKDKRQQRFGNQQQVLQDSKGAIDPGSAQEQQRLMNRAEFNKSHDYKRKSDKNRLEVGRISQGHPEDYDTLTGPNVTQKNMMAQTHYQNNLIPKDMLGQASGPHTINMHSNSPQSSIQQVQLQRKLVNTQGRKQRGDKSQEVAQQQRVPSKSPIRPIGTAAPSNENRSPAPPLPMQTQRKKNEQMPSGDLYQQATLDNSANKAAADTAKQKQRAVNNEQINSQKLTNQLPVKITSERFNCITKFAFATSVGHQPGNPNKPNQDAYVLVPNMLGQLGLHFFSVCDGHGVNGHHVSAYIKENLPLYIEKQLAQDKLFKSNSRLAEFYDRLPKQMHNAFTAVHSDLGKLNFDTELSGSTCVAILFDRNTIFSANAGDSRGVLYSYDRAQSGIKITPLSKDHKPCMPVEKKRVLSVGGRVDTIKGSLGQNLGPMRVWLMEQDAPGLAMSRSLGDFIAHSVGVSSDPEVMRFELQPEDKFIIIASDGVWEFLTNEMIAKIVWPFYLKNSPEQAGNAIVRAAATKWRENDTVIDDITCVTIFLEVDHQIPKIESAVYKKALINSSTEFPVNTSQQQPIPDKNNQNHGSRQSPKADSQVPKQAVKKRTGEETNKAPEALGSSPPPTSQLPMGSGSQRSPKPPGTMTSARSKPTNK